MPTRKRCSPVVALAVTLVVATSALSANAQERRFRAEAAPAANAENLAERRALLTRMAEKTIAEFGRQDATTKALLERAHGWAVLDMTKGGFIVPDAGGTGVAKAKSGNEAVFVHVGGAGNGVAELASYKLVLLFDDARTFEQFVTGKWQRDASAQAPARDGTDPAREHGFVNGAVAYRIDASGLVAPAAVQGLRFWPSDRLNELP